MTLKRSNVLRNSLAKELQYSLLFLRNRTALHFNFVTLTIKAMNTIEKIIDSVNKIADAAKVITRAAQEILDTVGSK
ncbi:MAG: hypothetical protein KBT00_08560 [Bacteroidales bacterium]|nr:hypothetical protein [Candidatus Cacconaster merdequi]